MRYMKSFFIFFLLFDMIILFKLEDDEFYIQLYPSHDKTKPYLSYFYNLKSILYTINSTEGENVEIIQQIVKNDELPLKNISSVYEIDDFLIKTCFGPNKIIEIFDEKNELHTPKDAYFKTMKNNLENIKYCYSTSINNPYRPGEYIIVTYWTEQTEVNGKEDYEHKTILFYPKTKSFSKIYKLDTKGNKYFAQTCTNLRNKYIYCNIGTSFSLSRNHHFSIIPFFRDGDNLDMLIRLVDVFASFSIENYHKPIGIFKYLYSKNGKYAEYFLTEIHDLKNEKTRLITSYYYNSDLRSFIHYNVDDEKYYGINIETQYIDPNLFNNILPNNQELIIIYIMKNPKGKNILLLNRYDYNKDLKYLTKFDKYSLSNYLRDDICDNPRYIQSMYVNSFIKYDDKDKEYMREHPDMKYYTYQKDIATVISCDKGDGTVFYEAKKIQLPQCLNILNEINGFSNSFIFTKDKEAVYIDFDENPNHKSLRNVQIEFLDSNLYNTVLMVQLIKNGIRQSLISSGYKADLSLYNKFQFTKTDNFRVGKTYQIPYRLIQSESKEKSSSCHLPSDICYFEFHYKKEIEEVEQECPHCKLTDNDKCIECDDITSIKIKNEPCGCLCDENEGFNIEPRTDLKMCVCKNGYSFYKDIHQCLPDTSLKNGNYCIESQDEKSLIYIYKDLPEGAPICYENGLPKCCKDKNETLPSCSRTQWFKLGSEIFYSYKLRNCVYIIFNKKIEMYSDKSECASFDKNDFNDCSGLNINSEEEYNSALENAYEYNSDDTNSSLIIKTDKATYYLLNEYTENRSSVKLSNACMDRVKEGYNFQSLLIFIATLKKPGFISTQVEYSFYNPNPEKINEKLNISLYCSNPKKSQSNLDQRTLEVSEEWKNTGNYTVDIDEILVHVQIDWNSEQINKIRELRSKNINIFDSADDFYNDVCFEYTTPENTDIYLQQRRERYYIKDPLCESDCQQVGYDDITDRVICKCKIKGSTEGFENVTFIPNDLDKYFEKKYILPNVRVLKCLFKGKLGIGQFFAILLLIIFTISAYFNCCKKRSFKKQINPNEQVNNINFYNNGNNDNTRIITVKRFVWEQPFDILLDKLELVENELNDNQNQLIEDDNQDDEEENMFRTNNRNIVSKVDSNSRIRNRHNIKNKKQTEELYSQGSNSENSINKKKETDTTKTDIMSDKKSIDKNSDILNINKNPIPLKNKNNKKKEVEENEEEEKKEEEEEEKKEENEEEDEKGENERRRIDIDSEEDYEEEDNEEEVKKRKKTKLIRINSLNKKQKKRKKKKNTKEKEKSLKKKEEEEKKSNIMKGYGVSDKGSEKSGSQPPEQINYSISTYGRNNANPPPRNGPGAVMNPQSSNTTARMRNNNQRNANQNEVQDGNQNDKDCQEKIIYRTKKYPENFNYLTRLLYKIIRESNIFYLFMNVRIDKNKNCCSECYHGISVKLCVFILFISCYLFFNILIEYDLSDLHLIYPKDKYAKSGAGNWILKALPPYAVFLIIHCIKKILNYAEFYYDENERVERLQKRKKDKKDNKIFLLIHNERTRIKKFKMNFYNNIKIISWIGIFFLICNLILCTSFFGIYHNSFLSVLINVIVSMLLSFGLNILIIAFETICNADWKKYIFCLYSPFCSCIYFILSGLTPFDEEFKENEEEDEERESERGNNARDDLDTGNQMVSDTNNSNN